MKRATHRRNTAKKNRITITDIFLLSDIFLHKGNDGARPPVAQTVTKSNVAMATEITVDIFLPAGRNTVKSICVLSPRNIEVFEKRRRTEVYHCAVIFLHKLNSQSAIA